MQERLGPTHHFTAADVEKAQVTRAARIAAGAHFRRDFPDAPLWEELASARGIRLPQWHEPPTPGQMGKWLRKLGISWQDYKVLTGERKMTDFARNNPDWGLRPWVGLLLESQESRESRVDAASKAS